MCATPPCFINLHAMREFLGVPLSPQAPRMKLYTLFLKKERRILGACFFNLDGWVGVVLQVSPARNPQKNVFITLLPTHLFQEIY